MRLKVFLFAAAATLLANVQMADAAVPTSNAVSAIDVAQDNNMGTRSLRTRETADDDLDDDSDDEERAGLTEIAGKLTKLPSLKTLLAEVDSLEAQILQGIATNKELFKKIEIMGFNPYQLREKLGISEKLKKMTSAQLDNDMDYHFWLQYSQWWKGTYGKDLGF